MGFKERESAKSTSGSGRFGDQAKGRTKPGGGSFVAGSFDQFKPGEIALWVRLVNPKYSQQVWDRELKEVVEKTDQQWWEYISHYVPSIGPRGTAFTCSAGPYRSKPCYGDAIRRDFYDKKSEREAISGTKEELWAPVGASSKFAIPLVTLEKIYQVPITDNTGAVRKSRKTGKPLTRNTPAPLIEQGMPKGATFPSVFGLKAHWSVGRQHLGKLGNYDDTLRNQCASCGEHLYSTRVVCPVCETDLLEVGEPLTGEDLVQVRAAGFTCAACSSYEGPATVLVECPCGTPEEGDLFSFELRIKATPIEGSMAKDLEIVGVRVPDPKKATYDEVVKMLNNPLDIPKIFSGDSLEIQRAKLGDMAKGVDPSSVKSAAAYGEEGEPATEDSGEGDIPF